MTDRTYEILKAKYAPHLVSDVPVQVTQVQASPVSMEEFALQVRKSYLEGCGLNPTDRHKWADNIVAEMVLWQMEQALGVKMHDLLK